MPVTAALFQRVISDEIASLQLESFDSTMRHLLLNLDRCVLSKCTDMEEPTAEQAAYDDFMHSNLLCSTWTLHCDNEQDRALVQIFRELATTEDLGLSFISWKHCFQHGNVGPGRAVGTNQRTFTGKLFGGSLCTSHSSLAWLYCKHIEHFPEWSRAEEIRRAQFGDVQVVEGASLSTVAKKRAIRRVITKVPALDMFYQLGMGSLLTKRLNMLGIHLSSQPSVNKRLAQHGSSRGCFATVDQKNASDRISIRMMREFFPRLTMMLQTISCRVAKYKGSFIPLHMIGTMGCGFTFPLQTLVYLTAVRACHIYVHGESRVRKWSDSFGVFGDDVVVNVKLYDLFVRLCQILGFEVNLTKSFSTGAFRESCGGDYHDGYNVRGVYLKSLATPQSRYSAANRLVLFCAKHQIYLPKSISFLLDGLPNRFVPMFSPVDSGLRVPYAVTDLSNKYLYWRVKPQRESHLMEGDGFTYVAFLGGYLRTDEIGWDEPRAASPYKCVQQGFIGVPCDDEDVQYNLDRRTCPDNHWDSHAVDGDGAISPVVAERMALFLLDLVTRKRR